MAAGAILDLEEPKIRIELELARKITLDLRLRRRLQTADEHALGGPRLGERASWLLLVDSEVGFPDNPPPFLGLSFQ